MRSRTGFALLALGALLAPAAAHAQIMSARRMAMGGVLVTRGGPGSDAVNVAYRAVPRSPEASGGVSLPIGLVPVLANPPELDSKKPGFNAFELANLLYDPPWNLTLSKPDTPSSDVTVSIAKNSLAVDLGDIRKVFPKDESRVGVVSHVTSLVVGIGRGFIGVSPLVHYQNDLKLNANLKGALVDAQPFLPRTDYALHDHALGQAAVQAMAGWAQSVWTPPGAADHDRSGLYAGARAKLLRGLVYGEADNTAAFTTGDTLFASIPVDLRYGGNLRSATPANGKFGTGLDVGAVWVSGASEFGLAINDIGTRIRWNVKESVVAKDSVSGNYSQQTVRESTPFTSEVPVTAMLTASTRVGAVLLAADVARSANELTTVHVGAEQWLGRIAVRAGAGVDANSMLQGSGGVGLRFGRLGLDLAIASNSRNLSRERAVELGAGLAFYH